jgi:hypothetical protein
MNLGHALAVAIAAAEHKDTERYVLRGRLCVDHEQNEMTNGCVYVMIFQQKGQNCSRYSDQNKTAKISKQNIHSKIRAQFSVGQSPAS